MCEIPVHCVIETLSEGCCMKCTVNGESTTENRKLLDSYAIVAGHTPLSKLNDAVVTALGFPQFVSSTGSASLPIQGKDATTPKGLIVIDNWKPLAFDQITDDIHTPIEHLFKHIGGNRWTLKILIPATLAKTVAGSEKVGENVSTMITTSDASGKVAEPDRSSSSIGGNNASTGANNWYQLFPRYHPYLANYNAYVPKLDSHGLATLMANRFLLSNAEVTAAAALVGHRSPLQASPPTTTWTESDEKGRLSFSNDSQPQSPQESTKSQSSPRTVVPQRRSVLVAPRSMGSVGSRHTAPTTCRLMFDPLTELPMLNEWFEQNSHPTCHDIERFTDLLNSKPYRRTYPPVSTHNVKIWFKNRRAKCKRA